MTRTEVIISRVWRRLHEKSSVVHGALIPQSMLSRITPLPKFDILYWKMKIFCRRLRIRFIQNNRFALSRQKVYRHSSHPYRDGPTNEIEVHIYWTTFIRSPRSVSVVDLSEMLLRNSQKTHNVHCVHTVSALHNAHSAFTGVMHIHFVNVKHDVRYNN